MSIKSEIVNFSEKTGCVVYFDEDMSLHTTFKTGGKADIFFVPQSKKNIKEVLAFCKQHNILLRVIGRGSNILVKDEGIRGAVMLIGKAISQVSLDGDIITCDAGADLGAVCIFAKENGLQGMEFAYGIPGSVGGAIYMNAGAYGGEMKDIVISANYIDMEGREGTIPLDNMELSYRSSLFQKQSFIVTDVSIKLCKGNKEEIEAKMSEILNKRRDKQPLNYPSAGSTFKRPQGAFAAQLIDECGLKGYAVGGAQVSEKHAGFVINKGGAISSDILKLVDEVKSVVKEKTGYELECEIRII